MTSKAGHTFTAGPWHVNHDRPDDKVSQLSISNGDARIIANVVTCDKTHGFDGGMSNARLIAAAPELLEALQGLVRFTDAVRVQVGMGKTQLERLAKARTAISRATAGGAV